MSVQAVLARREAGQLWVKEKGLAVEREEMSAGVLPTLATVTDLLETEAKR